MKYKVTKYITPEEETRYIVSVDRDYWAYEINLSFEETQYLLGTLLEIVDSAKSTRPSDWIREDKGAFK